MLTDLARDNSLTAAQKRQVLRNTIQGIDPRRAPDHQHQHEQRQHRQRAGGDQTGALQAVLGRGAEKSEHRSCGPRLDRFHAPRLGQGAPRAYVSPADGLVAEW